MNPISPADAASHEARNTRLRDVWEETRPPPIRRSKPFQKDLPCGRMREISGATSNQPQELGND